MRSLPFRVLLALTGFGAAAAQIVLLRELLVVFQGNEISLGLTLSVWLFWTAAGSALFVRLGSAPAHARQTVAALFLVTAFVLPGTIWAVRAGRSLLGSAAGEALGPGAGLLVCLGTLAAFCACSGCLFAAASRLYAAETSTAPAESTGTLYLLEAAGSAAGGMVVSLVLLGNAGSFQIAFLVSALNLAAAGALLLRENRMRLAVAAAALIAFAFSLPASEALERASAERLWRGFHLAGTESSVFGNLAIVGYEGAGSIYENGVPVAPCTTPCCSTLGRVACS